MTFLARLKARAREIRTEVYALYFAARHRGTPLYVKLYLIAVVAYALSPVDLIPDFIPVLGLLDELVLLPFAIILAIRLVPEPVMSECRARALRHHSDGSGLGRFGAAVIVLLWATLAVLAALWVHNALALEHHWDTTRDLLV